MRDPYDRRPWQLASRPAIVRRESQSYAHDFMKESERWRPNPWVANTFSYGHAYSNSCLSPRDPRPQLRIFPHEKRPFYSERNGFHTQPYGHEESDEQEEDDDQDEDEDENEKDRDNDDQESRTRMARIQTSRDVASTANTIYPTLQERHNELLHTDGHGSQASTDRYYYEAMRWQEGVAKAHREEQQQQLEQQVTMSHFDYLEQSSLLSASPPPPPRTSHGRLTRRASVAKAKFYKLLHHNSQQQTNSAARQDIRDVDFGDQGVHASDDVDSKTAETCKDLHYHDDNDNNGDADDNINDAADGSIHYNAGGLNSSNSAYSFTSSFRARVRLTRTKTVLRQVKQRLGAAARSVISEANKAANQVGPLLRIHSLARHHREQTRVDSEEDEI
ncbi:hypothetical protein BGZ68_000200 [Mortierella alpina]|nr:hypothetical protein BGZ68_000200 [Mortierella alpina]